METKILSSIQEHWQQLRKESQELNFHKGQVLFYEGHYPYGIFIITDGEVQFTRAGLKSPNKHRLPCSMGEVIGLDTFLQGIPYCCSCTAQEKCHVIFISKTQLLPFLDINFHFQNKNFDF